MNIIECDIPGPLILEPKVFGDERGFFMESWNAAAFAKAGLDLTFVQDNHSRSQKGVLRGMHFQRPPFAEVKLVRAVRAAGAAEVHLRSASPPILYPDFYGIDMPERDKLLAALQAARCVGKIRVHRRKEAGRE